MKCCLSEDVSYPRERALVNRRGRLGAVATISHPLLALIPQAIDCRLARLSVLYLNTWRICSPARCSLALCVRERKNRIHLQAFLPLESRDRFSWFSTFPSCLPRTILPSRRRRFPLSSRCNVSAALASATSPSFHLAR